MTSKLPPYPAEYLEITFSEEQTNENACEGIENSQNLPFAVSTIYNFPLKSAAYLTHGEDVKTVINICLDIKDSGIQYQPGDTFGILPENCQDEVDKLIDRLKYASVANKIYNLQVKEINNKKKFKIPPHVPSTSTIRRVLLRNLDIRSIPKKAFLRALSKYTTCESEVTAINDICSLHYTEFITKDYTTILELFHKFPSCFPPFTLLLEHLPKLLPRPYSVACSPFSSTPSFTELHFAFSLSFLPNSCEGVCTGWLNKKVKTFLQIQNKNYSETNSNVPDGIPIKIPVYLRKSNNFKLPEKLQTNIIMICSGTGIAPFIGFLQHLEIERINKKTVYSNFGQVWLFYGCRYSDRDFLFKDDLKHFIKTGILNKFFVSFSRENSTIKYVQNNIKENANNFIEMLENSIIYICGSANMSKGVFETIINCLIEVKNISNAEALDFVNDLINQNKYIEDVWS